MTLTRSKLEELVGSLVEKTFAPVRKAMEDARMKAGDINEVVLVGGQTRMPMVQKKVEEFFGKKPHMGVNPDEVVAIGAAVQAGVLQGDVKDVLLLDVTPLSLGIETLGGVMTRLIERNTTIPTSKSQVFSTAADNQTSVEIKVYQGEREMADANKLLGRFMLDGIPPAPRGVPQVEVIYDIDANGILHVTAKDKATSKEQKITISGSTGLSDAEIEKMRKDAETHAEEDKKKKEAIEHKNMADTLLYTTEKALKDAGAKLTDDERKPILEKMDELKQVKDKDDVEAIKKAVDALSEAIQKIGEKLYQSAQQPTEEPMNQGTTEQEKAEPVEAEFEEKQHE